MTGRIGTLLAALAMALGLAAGLGPQPAAAQRGDDAVLPAARVGVWTAERLRKSEPPYIDGAIAQVREKGEGRFAVLCERGDDKGVIAWRTPQGSRDAVRAKGDKIDVVFVFDKDRKIERTLRWNEAGKYWTARFGPNSPMAKALKASFELSVRVPGIRESWGDFTLDKSWRSIDAMFAMCRI